MRKVWGKASTIDRNLRKNWGKGKLLPTRDCEAGYGPGAGICTPWQFISNKGLDNTMQATGNCIYNTWSHYKVTDNTLESSVADLDETARLRLVQMPTHPPLPTLADVAVASSGSCHCYPEWHNLLQVGVAMMGRWGYSAATLRTTYLSGPLQLPQLGKAVAVLHYMRPMQPVRGVWMYTLHTASNNDKFVVFFFFFFFFNINLCCPVDFVTRIYLVFKKKKKSAFNYVPVKLSDFELKNINFINDSLHHRKCNSYNIKSIL